MRNYLRKKGNYKIGAILSYLTLAANCISGIFFTPFIIRTIGESEYGLYQLIGAYVGYLSILDMGMSSSVTKYIARYYRAHDKLRENGFLSLSLLIYSFLSTVAIVGGIILYLKISVIFSQSLSADEIKKAKIMFLLLLASIVITMIGGIFRGTMNAYECFINTKGAELARVVVRVILIWALITSGGGAVGIVVVDVVVNAIFTLYRMLFCFIVIKIRFRLFSFNSYEIKDFAFFALFVFLDMLFDQLNWKVDNTIIGIKMSTVAVTVYSIGANFSNYFMNFSIAIKSLFLPKVMHMESENATEDDYTSFLVHTGRLQGYLLFYLYIAFLLMGRQFIEIIMRKNYPDAWLSAVLVMSGLIVPLLQNGGHPILQAKNKHHIYVSVCLAVAIMNVIGTWMVIDRYGIVGAALMTMLSFIFGQALFLSWYYHKALGIDMRRFYSEIIKGNLLPAVVSLFFGALLVYIYPIKGWISFIVDALIYSLFYFACVFFMGMNDEEKMVFKRKGTM